MGEERDTMKKLNVLSLFDGIGTGMLALKRAGIPVDNYFSSEINKYAIRIADTNYPNIIQLGDVTNWKAWELPKIDMLIGGSPCNGFSSAGNKLGFDDNNSKLFFEYINILNYYKPKYFLLENVKMQTDWQNIITSHMNVEPILINSALVSAQDRKRLYWTNIPDVTEPKDKHIYLKDILLGLEKETLSSDNIGNLNMHPSGRGINGYVYSVNRNKSRTIGTNKGEGHKVAVPLRTKTLNKNIGIEFYGYTSSYKDLNRNRKVFFQKPTGSEQFKLGDKVDFVIVDENENNKTVTYGYIKKLSPIESERLQTLPDNFTNVSGVSTTQRYFRIGNSWTTDVITHIFSFIKKEI